MRASCLFLMIDRWLSLVHFLHDMDIIALIKVEDFVFLALLNAKRRIILIVVRLLYSISMMIDIISHKSSHSLDHNNIKINHVDVDVQYWGLYWVLLK